MTTEPPPQSSAPQLRPLGVGDIVDRVFTVYRGKPVLFLALAAVPYLVLVLVFVVLGIVFAPTLISSASTFNRIAQGSASDVQNIAGLLVGLGVAALFVIIL